MHGHRHAAHPAHGPGPARGVQRLPAAPLLQPDDYETIWDGERTARTGCVDTKRLLADRMLAALRRGPRAARASSRREPGYVEEVLRAGAERLAPMAARRCARATTAWGSARSADAAGSKSAARSATADRRGRICRR